MKKIPLQIFRGVQRALALAIFACFLVACSGCISLANRAVPSNYTKDLYPGVQFDWMEITNGGTGTILVLDAPFSFALDTVLLPVDIWVDHIRHGPLTGWTYTPFANKLEPSPLDSAMVNDYNGFIKATGRLDSPVFGYYEGSRGRRAVELEIIPPDSTVEWYYILIYDRENRRIKTIKWYERAYP